MQSVKLFMRQVGVPHIGLDVKGVSQVEEEIAYQFPDHELQESHYLGPVIDDKNNVIGYKVLFIFVKNTQPKVKDKA
jgi:hypothetical protein